MQELQMAQNITKRFQKISERFPEKLYGIFLKDYDNVLQQVSMRS